MRLNQGCQLAHPPTGQPHPGPIADLLEAITHLTSKPNQSTAHHPLLTNWPEIDLVLGGGAKPGGLSRGAVHEWVGLIEPASDDAMVGERCRRTDDWLPPLTMLMHLAAGALRADRVSGRHCVLWIGPRCWVYPPALVNRHHSTLLARSIFISPVTVPERMWAIDVALRSRGVSAVIADATGVRMPESRRFQLAAGAGGTLGLLVRPPREARELSAARTRWLVTPAPSPTTEPRWTVELLRCKGVRPAPEGARRWVVRQDHETGDVRLVPDAPDRRAAPSRPAACSA